MLFEQTGDCSQFRTEGAEFPYAVGFSALANSVSENLRASFFSYSRLAPVGHGLVERLQVFERGLGAFLCGRAEVFVEPPVSLAPGVGIFLAQLLGEVFANDGMGVHKMAPRLAVASMNEPELVQAGQHSIP